MRNRLTLVAVNLAAVTFFLLSFSRHGVGFDPDRTDLRVYRIASTVWLHGGNLYGALPHTVLLFTYTPIAAVLLAPLAVMPMAVANTVLTLATVALTALVLRIFLRSTGGRISVWWLLPLALLLEPVRSNIDFGQVNVILMALVALDALPQETPWARGTLTGLAAAVKLTPAAFILFFLLKGDRRAAGTAALSFAAFSGAGFLLAPADSVRYWTGIVTNTSRPGGPAYYTNQAITGVLARAGLAPATTAGTVVWLTLSAAVVIIAVIGMRRALAASEPAWALSLNALAALLISPISWSHHWVWGELAILVLWIVSNRHDWRAGRATAIAGLVVFGLSAQLWIDPRGGDRSLHWSVRGQVLGNSYAIFACAVLLLSAWWLRYRETAGPGPRAEVPVAELSAT